MSCRLFRDPRAPGLSTRSVPSEFLPTAVFSGSMPTSREGGRGPPSELGDSGGCAQDGSGRELDRAVSISKAPSPWPWNRPRIVMMRLARTRAST